MFQKFCAVLCWAKPVFSLTIIFFSFFLFPPISLSISLSSCLFSLSLICASSFCNASSPRGRKKRVFSVHETMPFPYYSVRATSGCGEKEGAAGPLPWTWLDTGLCLLPGLLFCLHQHLHSQTPRDWSFHWDVTKYCAFANDDLSPMPSLLAKVVKVQVHANSMSVGLLLLSSVWKIYFGFLSGVGRWLSSYYDVPSPCICLPLHLHFIGTSVILD